MSKTVGVRFKSGGKIYDFDCGAFVLLAGDPVIGDPGPGDSAGDPAVGVGRHWHVLSVCAHSITRKSLMSAPGSARMPLFLPALDAMLHCLSATR